MNNGNQTLRLFALESGVDKVLEVPLDSKKVYEAAGLIFEENVSKDYSDNESPDSWVWL